MVRVYGNVCRFSNWYICGRILYQLFSWFGIHITSQNILVIGSLPITSLYGVPVNHRINNVSLIINALVILLLLNVRSGKLILTSHSSYIICWNFICLNFSGFFEKLACVVTVTSVGVSCFFPCRVLLVIQERCSGLMLLYSCIFSAVLCAFLILWHKINVGTLKWVVSHSMMWVFPLAVFITIVPLILHCSMMEVLIYLCSICWASVGGSVSGEWR